MVKCKCGSTDYRTEQSGQHIKAICNKCDSYIQFLPQGMNGESLMYFGKYKGFKLNAIPPDYLVWLYENVKTNGSLKLYIEANLDSFKRQIYQSK